MQKTYYLFYIYFVVFIKNGTFYAPNIKKNNI